MLDSHPQIVCHGEVFKRRGIKRFLSSDSRIIGLSLLYNHLQQQYSNENIGAFIDNHLLNSSAKDISAVGFKFKTDEYFSSVFTDIADHLKQRTDLHIIHLRRKDLLAQYISHTVVKKKSGKTVLFQESESRRRIDMRLSISDVIRYMTDVIEREVRIENEFSSHQMIRCLYEDIAAEESDELDQLLAFLGVESKKIKKRTVKLLSDHYSLVRNRDEVIGKLIDAGFAERLSHEYSK